MELNTLFILNIMNAGISLIMGLYMLFLKRTAFKQGTGYWATGSMSIGFGFLLKTFVPADSYFSMLGFPVMVTLGLYLYLAGIWKFKEQKIHKWMIIGIPIVDFIQSIIFSGIFHFDKIRIGIHLTFLVFYTLYAIYEMIKLNAAQKYLKQIFLINTISFGIFLFLLLLNFYDLIQANNYNPIALSDSSLVLQIISGFVMIALTFGFLSAVNIRLTRELENQLKSKTKFLSIIGHDLRGPVGNIMRFLDLLQDENELDEQDRKKFLRTLNRLSHSTFHLLQNLLEWANKSKNINRFDTTRIELNELIASNIDFFKSSTLLKEISLEFKEGKPSFIHSNANMLNTVLRNLISNAVKFTPKGGRITISTERFKNSIRLVVADTGKGIKPEIIDSLFKFETNTSTKGTEGEVGSGFGLVLCKELVNSNKGTIKIESIPRAGTKVIVDFPFIN